MIVFSLPASLRGIIHSLFWSMLPFGICCGVVLANDVPQKTPEVTDGVVRDIRIEGLQRVSADSVFAVLPIEVGNTVSQSNIAALTRAVFSTGNFRDVEVGIDAGILVIKLLERPSISEITLEGNKAIKTEALLDGLKGQGMAEGRVFQRATLEGMQRELSRQYSGQGRYDAKITTDVVAKPRNRVAVEIVVDEGNAAKIERINIIGNTTFSDEEIFELMELKDRGFFARFNSSKKYSREKMSGDLESIEDHYLDRGFINFSIRSAQVSVGPEKDSVYIAIVVDEGEKYIVNSVQVAGDVKSEAYILERSFLIYKGQTFSQARVTQTEELMKRVMGNLGYAFAEIKNIPEINDDTNTVDITFFVEPKKRSYVRRVTFNGNRKTKDEVLRREMRQYEGALASTDLIERSRVRLERLGFFKEVEVETNEVAGFDDLVDVDFSVEEQSFGSVSASVGFSQDVGVIFGANLEQNNFLGLGKQLSVQANRSRYRTNYGVSYVNPYYTPDGVSRGFSLFFRETDFDEINIASFSTNSFGGSVIFGYPISETQSLRYSVGYTKTEIETGAYAVQEITASPLVIPGLEAGFARYVVADQDSTQTVNYDDLAVASAENFDVEQQGFVDLYGDDFGVVTLSGTWRESTLNRGVFATRGHSNSISAEVAVPGSEIEYFKVNYKGQYYFPITNGLALRIRGELGYGDGIGEVEDLPFFENFFSGGIGSVRGYESNTLGPRSTPSREYLRSFTATSTGIPVYILDPNTQRFLSKANDTPDPFGGNLLTEGSVELVFPTPFAKGSRSVRTVLFYDFGNVFSTDCRSTQLNCSNFDLSQLSSSVGVSLTWLSGFGPLSFSFARPVDQSLFDEREQFQFTLGGNL